MSKIPGNKPFVPPIKPPEVKGAEKKEQESARPAKIAARAGKNIGRGPEMDARAIAVRLSALATEAKEKEIAADEFERILEEVIKLTGLKDPQKAMEAASKKLQKEIEVELRKIKDNKDLMEEAEAWQDFATLLEHEMSQEQIGSFLGMIKDSIKGFA